MELIVRRIMARAVDFVVITPFSALLSLFTEDSLNGYQLGLFTMIIVIIYEAVSLSWKGTTIGKHLLKIKIEWRRESRGWKLARSITLGSLFAPFPITILVIYTSSAFLLFFSSQSIMDLATDTVVKKK